MMAHPTYLSPAAEAVIAARRVAIRASVAAKRREHERRVAAAMSAFDARRMLRDVRLGVRL